MSVVMELCTIYFDAMAVFKGEGLMMFVELKKIHHLRSRVSNDDNNLFRLGTCEK